MSKPSRTAPIVATSSNLEGIEADLVRGASAVRLLVVDDHIEMARMLADHLREAGYVVDVAGGGAEALAIAQRRTPDVVITDLRMEQVDGFDVMEAIQRLDPLVPVIIMTAFGAVESAIDAIRRGAYQYLTKPFQLEEVLVHVERACRERRLKEENRALQRLVDERSEHRVLIGDSLPMRELKTLLERVAAAETPVLVLGESGVGKEIVARTIHALGPHSERRFVAINCSALPESILESELFGHVRGAFTGATTNRRGLFVEADGGTLLLDEIGEMAPALQAKLLRVLEDGEIRPVGADSSKRVSVRVIAATHRDLGRLMENGLFREDLYYRLNVLAVNVPPLRDRTEDIPALVAYFVQGARQTSVGAVARRLSPDALKALSEQPWPGNVRELKNLIHRAVLLSSTETVTAEDLEACWHRPSRSAAPSATGHAPESRDRDPQADGGDVLEAALGEALAQLGSRVPSLQEVEIAYISRVMQQCNGNKTQAARLLGIDVSTIHRRGRRKG